MAMQHTCMLYLLLVLFQISAAFQTMKGANFLMTKSPMEIKRPARSVKSTVECSASEISRRAALFGLATTFAFPITKVLASEPNKITAKPDAEKFRNLSSEKLKELVLKDVNQGQFLVTGKLTRSASSSKKNA
jgi:hypothetical protein